MEEPHCKVVWHQKCTGTNSYLPESPMRTINWGILRWSFANAAWLQSSRPPRPTANKGTRTESGQ